MSQMTVRNQDLKTEGLPVSFCTLGKLAFAFRPTNIIIRPRNYSYTWKLCKMSKLTATINCNDCSNTTIAFFNGTPVLVIISCFGCRKFNGTFHILSQNKTLAAASDRSRTQLQNYRWPLLSSQSRCSWYMTINKTDAGLSSASVASLQGTTIYNYFSMIWGKVLDASAFQKGKAVKWHRNFFNELGYKISVGWFQKGGGGFMNVWSVWAP